MKTREIFCKENIGKEIIRTASTLEGGNAYRADPLVLVDVQDGVLVKYAPNSIAAKIYGEAEFWLPYDEYLDDNWIFYQDACLPDYNNPLNAWRGKKVRRIRPTEFGDYSFVDSPYPMMLSANFTHILVLVCEQCLTLPQEYADSADWEVVQE